MPDALAVGEDIVTAGRRLFEANLWLARHLRSTRERGADPPDQPEIVISQAEILYIRALSF